MQSDKCIYFNAKGVIGNTAHNHACIFRYFKLVENLIEMVFL